MTQVLGEAELVGAAHYCDLMAQDGWPARLAKTIARQVRHYRQERGLSAQQMADRLAELGLPVQRAVLANLENGRRGNVTIAEVLALAKVLKVPPILLLFPIGQSESIEALPDQRVPTWEAAKWFMGEDMLSPNRQYYEGDHLVSAEVFAEDLDAWEKGAVPVRIYRQHDSLSREWRHATAGAKQDRLKAEQATNDEVRASYERAAEVQERDVRRVEDQIRYTRRIAIERGLVPPALDPELAHLEVKSS